MLTQKLFLGYSGTIASQLITVAVTIVVARVAGPSVLGTLAFAQAFVSMWLFLADPGITVAHIKIVSEGKDEADANATFFWLKSAFNALYTVTFLVGFWLSIHKLGFTYEGADHRLVILIFLATAIVGEFSRIPTTTFMAHAEQAKQAVPEFLRNLVQQALRLVLVLLGFAAVALSLGGLVAAGLVLPAYFFLYRDYPRGHFCWDLVRKYVTIALPVLVVVATDCLTTYSDRVFLQYVGKAADVGYYAAGYRVGGFVLLVGTAIGNLFFPIFSQAFARKEIGLILDRIRRYERFACNFVLPCVLFVVLFAPAIVRLALGRDYGPSVPVVGIVTLATFLSITNTPYSSILSGKGRFRLSAGICVANFFVYLAFAFLFCSRSTLGLRGTGMALALLGSYLTVGAAFRVFAKATVPELRVLHSVPRMAYALTVGCVAWLVSQGVADLGSTWIGLICALAYFPAFFGGAWLLGFLGREDVLMVGELLNARKMRNYISEELGLGRGTG